MHVIVLVGVVEDHVLDHAEVIIQLMTIAIPLLQDSCCAISTSVSVEVPVIQGALKHYFLRHLLCPFECFPKRV